MKDSKYQEAVQKVAQTYEMNSQERQSLLKSKAARIAAELPYISGCKNPDLICLRALGVFFTAHKNPVFDHSELDTLRDRLFDLNIYKTGDSDKVECGLKQLELISLEDHYTDRYTDKAEGKYNPINAGTIDYEKTKKDVLAKISDLFGDLLDDIRLWM